MITYKYTCIRNNNENKYVTNISYLMKQTQMREHKTKALILHRNDSIRLFSKTGETVPVWFPQCVCRAAKRRDNGVSNAMLFLSFYNNCSPQTVILCVDYDNPESLVVGKGLVCLVLWKCWLEWNYEQ